MMGHSPFAQIPNLESGMQGTDLSYLFCFAVLKTDLHCFRFRIPEVYGLCGNGLYDFHLARAPSWDHMLVIIRVFITFPSSEGSELGPYACHGRTTAQQCCIFPLGR